MEDIDVIQNIDNVPSCSYYRTPEPIVIRGIGRLTIFGLSSRFDSEFPSVLIGRLAPEEFRDTIQRFNYILQQKIKPAWLFCGVLFCCCTISCSLWPLICLSRRTIFALEKAIDYENRKLYNDIGLHWKLARLPMEHNARLTEYVLLIETLPKIPLMFPD